MNRRGFLRNGLAAAGAAGLPALSFPVARNFASEPDVRRPIRLNSNENSLGLSPAARRAIASGVEEANRYAFAVVGELIEQLADYHSVGAENLILGNGSTEVIQMAVLAFSQPGTRFVVPDPTFEDVLRYSAPFPVEIVKVPLAPDYSHDLPSMRRASENRSAPVLVYICNPNNPTGTLTSCEAIRRWIETSPETVHFLIDEAYFDFVEDSAYFSFLQQATQHPRVLVTRTFSKVFAMAGLRVGYGIGSGELIGRLSAYSKMGNLNQLGIRAARASLSDPDFVNKSLSSNRESRQILVRALEHLELKALPSQTNFVMFRLSVALSEFIGRMADHEIRVGRPFPPMLDYCRLSLGLPEEMEIFVRTLEKFRQEGWV